MGLREWHTRPTQTLLCVLRAWSLDGFTQRTRQKDVICIPKSRWYMLRITLHFRRTSLTPKSASGSNKTTHELDRDWKKKLRRINFSSHATNERNNRADYTSIRTRRTNFRPLPLDSCAQVNDKLLPSASALQPKVHPSPPTHPNPASN